MKINTYIVRTIRDMLSLSTIKLALMTAVPLFFIWVGIGWLLWEPLVNFTTQIITWVPFSIVRANGAFVITFMLWFIAVLVSYAIFIGLFSAFILGGKKESRFEAINFTLIFIFSIFWAGVIMIFWPDINYQIQRFLTILPFDTVAKGIAWILAFYILYNLFLITEYFVVFLFREPFLKALAEKYAGELDITPRDISGARTYYTLYKDIFWFFIASILILPILFIPIANFLAVWFVWAWLYKESAFIGVCSLLCTKEEYMRLKEHKAYLVVASLSAALLNFIPIINVFTPFFIMDLYFHWVMEIKKESETIQPQPDLEANEEETQES